MFHTNKIYKTLNMNEQEEESSKVKSQRIVLYYRRLIKHFQVPPTSLPCLSCMFSNLKFSEDKGKNQKTPGAKKAERNFKVMDILLPFTVWSH